MNGLIPFERTMKQTIEKKARTPKTITAANRKRNYKLVKAATLLNTLKLTKVYLASK